MREGECWHLPGRCNIDLVICNTHISKDTQQSTTPPGSPRFPPAGFSAATSWSKLTFSPHPNNELRRPTRRATGDPDERRTTARATEDYNRKAGNTPANMGGRHGLEIQDM